MNNRKARERGGVLIVAMMVITVLVIMTVPFLAKMSTQVRSSERTYRALSAFNLAEAGADRVLWEMNRPYAVSGGIIVVDEDGNRAFGPVSEGVGPWTGEFEGTIADNLAADTRTLVSTGRMPFIGDGTVERTIELGLAKDFDSVFDFGFFVDDYFIHGTNFLLDSYDSREGPYGGDNIGTLGWFGTNGSDPGTWVIDRGTSSEIQGGVAAGWETDPDSLGDVIDIPDGTQGDHETTIMAAEFELPSVNIFDLPAKDMFGAQGDESLAGWFTDAFENEYLALDEASGLYNYQKAEFMPAIEDIESGFYKGGLAFERNSSTTLTSADSGIYASFQMEQNATVTIEGHVILYMTGVQGAAQQAEFANHGGSILLAEDATLTMIFGNSSFFLENTTAINVNGAGEGMEGTPADCIILGTDQFSYQGVGDIGLLSWENAVNISAAIYAPRAHLAGTQGNTNIDLWGAAILKSWDTKSNIDLHFDEALGDLVGPEGGIPHWDVVHWRERVGGL